MAWNTMNSEDIDILGEGYLVQKHGNDPSTGERWKPTWVVKRDCSEEAIAQWEARDVIQRRHSMETLGRCATCTRHGVVIMLIRVLFAVGDVSDHYEDDQASLSYPDLYPSRKRSISDLVNVKEESQQQGDVLPSEEHTTAKRPRYTSLSARAPSYGPLHTGFKSVSKFAICTNGL